MQKIKIAFTLATVLMATACSKDIDKLGDENPQQNNRRLASISRIIGYSEQYWNDTLRYTTGQMLIPGENTDRLSFFWESDRLSAAEFGNWLRASFVYDDNNILKDCHISRSDGEPGTADQYKERFYHMVYENGLLNRVEVTDSLNSSFHQTYSITSTSDGRIASMVSTNGISHNFTWQDGNVVCHEQCRRRNSGKTDTVTEQYTYDNTASIYTDMMPLVWVLMDEEMGIGLLTCFNMAQIMSRNNIINTIASNDGFEDVDTIVPTPAVVPSKSSGLSINYHHQRSDGYILKTEASFVGSNYISTVNTYYTYHGVVTAIMPLVYNINVQDNMNYTPSYPAWVDNIYGGGVFEEGNNIAIYASPYYTVYLLGIVDTLARFVKWDDGNTDNPRYIKVTSDAVYTAVFE